FHGPGLLRLQEGRCLHGACRLSCFLLRRGRRCIGCLLTRHTGVLIARSAQVVGVPGSIQIVGVTVVIQIAESLGIFPSATAATAAATAALALRLGLFPVGLREFAGLGRRILCQSVVTCLINGYWRRVDTGTCNHAGFAGVGSNDCCRSSGIHVAAVALRG